MKMSIYEKIQGSIKDCIPMITTETPGIQYLSNSPLLIKSVSDYANIVGKSGPECEGARAFRLALAHWSDFIELADAIDRIKRNLGGSGMLPSSKNEALTVTTYVAKKPSDDEIRESAKLNDAMANGGVSFVSTPLAPTPGTSPGPMSVGMAGPVTVNNPHPEKTVVVQGYSDLSDQIAKSILRELLR